jgi:hypothetical protein
MILIISFNVSLVVALEVEMSTLVGKLLVKDTTFLSSFRQLRISIIRPRSMRLWKK